MTCQATYRAVGSVTSTCSAEGQWVHTGTCEKGVSRPLWPVGGGVTDGTRSGGRVPRTRARGSDRFPSQTKARGASAPLRNPPQLSTAPHSPSQTKGGRPVRMQAPPTRSRPPKVLVPAFLQLEIWGETAGATGAEEFFSASWRVYTQVVIRARHCCVGRQRFLAQARVTTLGLHPHLRAPNNRSSHHRGNTPFASRTGVAFV